MLALGALRNPCEACSNRDFPSCEWNGSLDAGVHIIGAGFLGGSLLVVTHVLAVHAEGSHRPTRVSSWAALGIEAGCRAWRSGCALMVIPGLFCGSRPRLPATTLAHAKLLLVVVLMVLDFAAGVSG